MPGEPKGLRLHPDASTELQNSVSFYRQHAGERLALRFKQHVRPAFKATVAAPHRFPPAREFSDDMPVRRLRLKHFPFAIFYLVRADHIWIVAFAHGSRRPGYWKDRTAE